MMTVAKNLKRLTQMKMMIKIIKIIIIRGQKRKVISEDTLYRRMSRLGSLAEVILDKFRKREAEIKLMGLRYKKH